jgi:hypothetical protein
MYTKVNFTGFFCRLDGHERAPILTMTNVQGMLTNSDLELAGTVVQHEATAANFDVLEPS